MRAVILTEEQQAMLEAVRRCTEQFDRDPRLIGVAEMIEQARAMVGRAHEAGLPEQAYVGLQLYVSMHDNDARLPPHLRTDWSTRKPR